VSSFIVFPFTIILLAYSEYFEGKVSDDSKYDDIDIEEIKKMILINSSSINFRCKTEIYNHKKWNIIKDYVEKTQKYLLNS
jgi:hypothetical protein